MDFAVANDLVAATASLVQAAFAGLETTAAATHCKKAASLKAHGYENKN